MVRHILRAASAVATGLDDLILPRTCLACGSDVPSAGGLCERCNVELLSLVALPACPRCGTTLGPNIPVREDGCDGCPSTLPRFEQVIRLGPYTGPLRSIVRELKYRRRAMRRRLGEMLGRAVLSRCEEELDVVMPVPMHWRRRLARGQNHASTLAGAVAGPLALPTGGELIRVRNTPPQTHLPRSRRAENVRGAFAVAPASAVEGAGVLLVDDVTTTGATANEAARTLLRAGATRVVLAVVCKAEPPTAYSQPR